VIFRISAVIFALLSLGWIVSTSTFAQTDERDATHAKLQTLLRDRNNTLQERVDALKSMRKSGSVEYDRLASAIDELLLAKLEVASTDAERIALCRQRIDNLRANEEFAALRFEQGSGSLDKKLIATARRLQAEIDCVREMAKSD
jgi:hypothetical protein